MTTANKLTVFRMALVPVFLAVLYWDFPGAGWVAVGIFILASLTDLLDGIIARRCHQVSDFGKFLDPLADKVLVLSALAWSVEQDKFAGWMLAVVLARELAVSGLRMVAVEQGKVIAAAWSGKIKTGAAMVCICHMLVYSGARTIFLCKLIILATTVYSGVEYFVRNRSVFRREQNSEKTP